MPWYKRRALESKGLCPHCGERFARVHYCTALGGGEGGSGAHAFIRASVPVVKGPEGGPHDDCNPRFCEECNADEYQRMREELNGGVPVEWHWSERERRGKFPFGLAAVYLGLLMFVAGCALAVWEYWPR